MSNLPPPPGAQPPPPGAQPPPPGAQPPPPGAQPPPPGGVTYQQPWPQQPMTAHEAKANAKAAKAHAKAMRPWYKKKRYWLLAVIVVIVIAVATNGGGGDDDSNVSTTGGAAGVDKGFGSKDASGDISSITLGPKDALGFRKVELKVTNNSSKRSNYYIEVSVESPDGKTQYDRTVGTVSNVEPGQTAIADLLPITKQVPDDAKAVVKTVSRTAS